MKTANKSLTIKKYKHSLTCVSEVRETERMRGEEGGREREVGSNNNQLHTTTQHDTGRKRRGGGGGGGNGTKKKNTL